MTNRFGFTNPKVLRIRVIRKILSGNRQAGSGGGLVVSMGGGPIYTTGQVLADATGRLFPLVFTLWPRIFLLFSRFGHVLDELRFGHVSAPRFLNSLLRRPFRFQTKSNYLRLLSGLSRARSPNQVFLSPTTRAGPCPISWFRNLQSAFPTVYAAHTLYLWQIFSDPLISGKLTGIRLLPCDFYLSDCQPL